MCLSLSCLVDSVSGGPRQSFFIHPDVTDKAAPTAPGDATLASGFAADMLHETLSALESLLVRASRLSVEDKYSMNFRRTEEDYTLLGRGALCYAPYILLIVMYI